MRYETLYEACREDAGNLGSRGGGPRLDALPEIPRETFQRVATSEIFTRKVASSMIFHLCETAMWRAIL
jgi:hypothetical protein